MKTEIGIAGDYAYMSVGNIELYYGYEETNEEEEWCFTAEDKSTGESVKWSWKELPSATDQFNVGECLLCGIARLFQEGVLLMMPGLEEL